MPIIVEEAIQEAQREGRFQNLPGKGKPLQLDPSPDAVINNLIRDAKMRPVWIEVGCEIDDLLQRAAHSLEIFARRHSIEMEELSKTAPTEAKQESPWRRWWRVLWSGSDNRLRRGDPVAVFNRRWDAELSRQATLLHGANAKIRRFNYIVPLRDLQRNSVSVSHHLQEFTHRFVKLTHDAQGAVVTLRGTVPPALLQPPAKLGETTTVPRDVRQRHLLDATH